MTVREEAEKLGAFLQYTTCHIASLADALLAGHAIFCHCVKNQKSVCKGGLQCTCHISAMVGGNYWYIGKIYDDWKTVNSPITLNFSGLTIGRYM